MELALKILWTYMSIGVCSTICFIVMETLLLQEKGLIEAITDWANKDKTEKQIKERDNPLRLTLAFLLEVLFWPVIVYMMFKAYPDGLTVMEWMQCEEEARKDIKAEKMVEDAMARLKAKGGYKVELQIFDDEEELQEHCDKVVKKWKQNNHKEE